MSLNELSVRLQQKRMKRGREEEMTSLRREKMENKKGNEKKKHKESEVYLQNYAALDAFFQAALNQLHKMKTSNHQERRMQNTVEDLFCEGETYCKEGERLEAKGEMALSLAFFTNAASKFKQITGIPTITSEAMLRAQIRRESCLKKARTMYRRLLVQSAQKTTNAPQRTTNAPQSNIRPARRTNQVTAEKRTCATCDKRCFWLKDGLCSDCDLKATEVHRKNARRNHSNMSRVCAPRDFTRPRETHRPRKQYSSSEYSSSEEEYAPVKSCAICHTYRTRCG